MRYIYTSELYHHGIKGQQWGVKNGPPYPLSGGQFTRSEKHDSYKKRIRKYSLYNKKHFDRTIEKSDTIQTLSYDRNRTQNTDMFYAVSTNKDRHYYNAFFNKKVSDGNKSFYKFRIINKVKSDIDVASEDSGSKVFMELYSKNRDFYNFVRDPKRMESYFVKDKYKFKGYREALDSLNKLRNETPSDKDLKMVYRMFNYIIPSSGKDVLNQRSKFFKSLGEKGYSAVLDTNDAIYGGFKADSPIIVFDLEKITRKSADRISKSSKRYSVLISIGRKAIGI